MIFFRIVPHGVRLQTEIVEVWVDDKMVAAVYPQEPNSIRVISAHIIKHGQEIADPMGYKFSFETRFKA